MTSIGKTGIALAGAILLCVGGTAQAAPDTVATANVPFAFEVNGQTMPAGKYLIQRDESTPSVLLIRGEQKNNHAAAFVLTIRDGGQDPAGSDSVLAFKRYENTYRLAGVWDSNEQGFDLLNH